MPTKTRVKKTSEAPNDIKAKAGSTPQVDYPRDSEAVQPGHYAIRISAEGGSEVEVSIDGGGWQACRYAVGHWWFDWMVSGKGGRVIKTRSRLGDSKWKESKGVRCQVVGA